MVRSFARPLTRRQRWWLENAYTRWDDPIVINSNWQVLIDEHPVSLALSGSAAFDGRGGSLALAAPVDQAIRAAGLAHNLTCQYLVLKRYGLHCCAAPEFVRARSGADAPLVRSEELPRDYARDTPLCMDQYRHIFATARIPDRPVDRVETYTDSRHIVVLCREQFFVVQVVDDSDQHAIPAHRCGSWSAPP